MIAIFTDQNNRVILRHYRPEQLSAARLSEAALQVESEPAPPDYDPETQRADLYVVDGTLEWHVTDR